MLRLYAAFRVSALFRLAASPTSNRADVRSLNDKTPRTMAGRFDEAVVRGYPNLPET